MEMVADEATLDEPTVVVSGLVKNDDDVRQQIPWAYGLAHATSLWK